MRTLSQLGVRPLNQLGTVTKIVKSVLPLTSSCLFRLRMQGLVRYAEVGAALLQGKGAGSGWDLSAEIRAAANCISRADPVLVDVGANYGQWSQSMANLFPRTQKVLLFEPQADCVAVLNDLELPGKVIVPAAVSDQCGSQIFYVNHAGSESASLFERGEVAYATMVQNQLTVPVTTLDTVVESEGVEYIDFAKFDIEGAELSAFRGATRCFSRGAIGALSLEFGSGNINSRTFFRDFWRLLTGYGFDIFRVLPGGYTIPIDHYYEDLEYFRGVSNYVARRKNQVDHRTNSARFAP